MSACEPPKACQDGMLGPRDPEQCQVLGEGCVCSEGTILHRRHSGLCIPEEKCGKSLPSPGRGSLPWRLVDPRVSFALLCPWRGPLHPSRSALGVVSFPGRVWPGMVWVFPPSSVPGTSPCPLQPAQTAQACLGPWGRLGTAPSVAAASTSAKLQTRSSRWTGSAPAPALKVACALGRWPCCSPLRTPAAWGRFAVSPALRLQLCSLTLMDRIRPGEMRVSCGGVLGTVEDHGG